MVIFMLMYAFSGLQEAWNRPPIRASCVNKPGSHGSNSPGNRSHWSSVEHLHNFLNKRVTADLISEQDEAKNGVQRGEVVKL